jgi:amidohydrolase
MGDLLREGVPQLVAWRRHLHRHPELAFEEHLTSRFIISELERLGIGSRQPTPTSVVAEIVGDLPGPTIACRADIDALPIEEKSEVEFFSRNPGVMHACGHDGHTAALLGVGAALVRLKASLAGRVRLIFQHAEEVPNGGASELIDAGVLDSAESIIGIHLWTPLPIGVVGLADGPAMASTDYFAVEFLGAGGHAGAPHETPNPIAAGADFVQDMQMLVYREIGALTPAVVVVTRMQAGEALNVIPSGGSVAGTIRTLAPEIRKKLREAVKRLATQVADNHGLRSEISFTAGPPPLINDRGVVQAFAAVGERCAGVAEVRMVAPLLAGDDFACYLEHIPGAYAFVGAGLPVKAGPFPHHHPAFVIEEKSIEIATELLFRTVLLLAERPAPRVAV